MKITQVQAILHEIGLRPQQAAGQNFLLDESICASIVSAAGVEPEDTVLEIGPGLGILTEALLETGAKIIAVEIDQRLYAYLKKKFRGQERLRLIHSDIFKVNLNTIIKEGEYKLVANLPYSATSLVFRNFLSLPPRPSNLTVMIQRDVAKRITAKPGDMSLLSLTTQFYSRPIMLFDVPPSSFFPIPKVTSSVLYCDDFQPLNPDQDKKFWQFVRAGFAARRKKLATTLATSLHIPAPKVAEAIESTGLHELVRAQELSLEQWLKLAKKLVDD